MMIIGVVSDFRSGRLGILQPDDVNALPQVFYPDALRPMIGGELIVRVAGNPAGVVEPIRRAIQTRAGARLVAVRTLEDQRRLATAPRRFNTRVFVAFAGLAMLLAAVGVGGVFRYAVAQRTQEIGLRLALGPNRLDILRMILAHAAGLAIVGIVVCQISPLGSHAFSPDRGPLQPRRAYRSPVSFLLISTDDEGLWNLWAARSSAPSKDLCETRSVRFA
jgi:hypothetical protein